MWNPDLKLMPAPSQAAAARALQPPAEALWPLSNRANWVALPLVAAAYFGAAGISLTLAIPPGYASAVWPPAGMALAAWLAFGGRIWPGIMLGAALANLGVMGTPVWVALVIGAGNAAEAVLAGLLIRRFLGLGHRFETVAAVWRFAAIAFGAALVAASNGVFTLALAGQIPWSEFGAHWITWWLGDATGMIIVAPLLLCWTAPGNGTTAAERRIEYQLFGALLVLCATCIWAVRFSADTVQKLAYLMIPLVTWAAARLDQRAVTAASFAICVVAIVDMLDGAASMFMPMPLNESLLLLQLFVSAVALTGLSLSALSGEVVRVNARLQGAHAELEREVQERTTQLDRTLAHQLLLAKRMVKIRDEERARLAADLHDGVARDLTSLGASLDQIQRERREKSAQWLDRRLADALAVSLRAGTTLREIIDGRLLRGLEGIALSSALHRHVAEFEARTGIVVNVESVPGRDLLPLKVKDGLLRICLEALANVANHADAKSVRITLQTDARRTRLVVEDDGRGFDPAAVERQRGSTGAGLLIMRERAIAIGASFRVRSAPGSGTAIDCTVAAKRP